MQRVYIQNKDGEPLMPTARFGAVRRWLRDNKAIVVNLCPFTIRLTKDCETNKQEVVVGLDTGAVNIGCGAVSKDKCLYASETKLRTDIHKKMQRRLKYRRNRRTRKLRYRPARFDNRTSKRQLPPSLQSKLDSTVKVIKQLSKILPITKVVVEIAKFDIQKLQNPDIQGIEYQKGVTEGYDNLRAYCFERDKYTCQICKKPRGILQIHHIRQRKDSGSNKPDNLVTVHKDCHEDFHKGKIQHKFTKPKEYKVETHITILKDFIIKELRKYFNVEITFGHITKRNRLRLNLPKSHCFDAVAIANPKKIEHINRIYKRVCVTQRRYQMTKGVRSEKRLPAGELFGFKQWDKVKINNQIGFIKGKRSCGFFDVCDIDGKNISHSIKHTKLQRLNSNNVMEVNAIPPTNKLVGIFA
jgi:hypothetical protein